MSQILQQCSPYFSTWYQSGYDPVVIVSGVTIVSGQRPLPPAIVGRHLRPSSPSFLPANPGLGAPCRAQITPASRMARISATRRRQFVLVPAREVHALPSGYRKLTGPVPKALSCSSGHVSALVSAFALQPCCVL